MTARQQTFGIKIRLAAQLNDAVRYLIRVPLLIIGMLQKLCGHALGVNSRSHKIVALVTQDADNFGGQRLVQ